MSAVLQSRTPATGEATLAGKLADFALKLELDQVPEEVIAHARLCILDACGIALASTRYPFAEMAAEAVRNLAGDGGSSAVIGLGERFPLRDAMLLNGLLIHGLDFDDTHSGSVIHATASAWPVALAVGQQLGVSGADAMAAYILALEADARIGNPASGEFQKRGHHPTGLIGAFGATLAAGRLHGLSASQLERAQGIVLSMAAGNLEFLGEGDWTKRLHPGWAGVSGVTAAALAKSGFLGPRAAYEGRYGLYNLHLGPDHGKDLAAIGAGLGETWEVLNVAFKPYPACHFNHAFADATLALRRQHAINPDQIDSVTALIHPKQMEVVCEPEARKRAPDGSYEAQFSVHYVIACCLVHDRFTLDQLDETALSDPRVLALTPRIGYAEDPRSAYPASYSGEVVIRMRDGTELRHREAVNRGSRDNPISADDVEQKFFDNALRVIDEDQARRIRDRILELDQLERLDPLADDLMYNGD